MIITRPGRPTKEQVSKTMAEKRVLEGDHGYSDESPRKKFARVHCASIDVAGDKFHIKHIGRVLQDQLLSTGSPRRSSRVKQNLKVATEAASSKFAQMEVIPESLENLESGNTELISRFPKNLAMNIGMEAGELCEGLLDDPIRLAPCVHNCCRQCLAMHLQMFGGDCPVCHTVLVSLTEPDLAVVCMLNNVKVRCHNHTNGCQVIKNLDEL